MDIRQQRCEYLQAGLARNDLHTDPMVQFERWFQAAQTNAQAIENAMSLATVDSQGMPSVRTVLLKSLEPTGFVFFTHYHSRKGQDLATNPQAALLFQWLSLERQVQVQGQVEKISPTDSADYFTSRPRGSQLAVWCAQQSTALTSREALTHAFQQVEQRFAGQTVPVPEDWGGYRLRPHRIEFWQGRENRLHDRFVYEYTDGAWHIQRLAP